MRSRKLIGILGKPNVGKSTLFNRLVGSNKSLISATPGTTRDALYSSLEWMDQSYDIVDTGGMLMNGGTPEVTSLLIPTLGQNVFTPLIKQDPFAPAVTEVAMGASSECDVLLMLIDSQSPPNHIDHQVARTLKRHPCVLLVANKADNEAKRDEILADNSLRSLGLGPPHPVSAIHGDGTIELLDAINVATGGKSSAAPGGRKIIREQIKAASKQPKVWDTRDKNPNLRIAVLGVPNAGKSSVINSVLGEERCLVSDMAGTTHDVVDSSVVWKGETPITLLDTAGIQRRSLSKDTGIDRASVLWSLRASKRSNVNVLLLDAATGVTAHDKLIARHLLEGGNAIIVCVNKSDLLINQSAAVRKEYEEGVRSHLRFMPWVPVMFCSALEDQKSVAKLVDKSIEVYQQRMQKIPTNKLMEIISRAMLRRPPPTKGHMSLRITFCTQAKVNKPTFVFFCNYPTLVHFSYSRFLENSIRQVYPFEGTPIAMKFKGKVGGHDKYT